MDFVALVANPVLHRLYGGQMNERRVREVRAVTHEAVFELHRSGSLLMVISCLTRKQLVGFFRVVTECPGEDEMVEDPKGLTVDLMIHQKKGLKWLLWREAQAPPGGILGTTRPPDKIPFTYSFFDRTTLQSDQSFVD